MNKELELAYVEYIVFLEEYIGSLAGYLYSHNMKASPEQITRGIVLRNQIKLYKGEHIEN